VPDFETLKTTDCNGKIVVINPEWDAETASLVVRQGASEAARFGAVGCLVRSASPFSLGTMHVGVVEYEDGLARIPVATITSEEASTLQGLFTRKRVATIQMWMDPQEGTNTTSHNIIAHLDGGDKKDEVVVIGAHIDTLELGQGVQDSLAGFVMAWEGLRIMKYHNMKPTRSIRVVGWTGSELGHVGAEVFSSNYAASTVFALEANRGSSEVEGILVSVFDDKGYDIMKGIGGVFSRQAAAEVDRVDNPGQTNLLPLYTAGVPVATFKTADGDSEFWWYSHSDADGVDTLDAEQLRTSGGIMAGYAYCVASAEENVPKKAAE